MFRLLAALAAFAVPPDTAHLVLVATTDVHGHATEWDFVADRAFPGGLSRAATVIDSLRARYPGQVVVCDVGDLISGDPFADYYARVAPRDPHPVVEAMDLAGYDVATPGNHDFDYGVPTFERATARTTVRFVSGNIRGLPADSLVLPGHVVLRRGEIRIGITGFTTPGVMVWDAKQLRGRLRVARIEPSAAAVLPSLRRESDVAVVLIHSGLAGPSSYDTTGVGPEDVAARLAGLVPKPDLVVVGHSHREIVDTVIDGVHFVQPKPHARSLAVVHVTLRRRFPGDDWRVAQVRGESVSLADVAPSARFGRLARLQAHVREWMGRSIGEARGDMPATLARAQPTPVINLIHEVQKKRSGAVLSSTSAFDLRAGFRDGDIRVRDLFALYPYENTLRAIRISGAQLKDYLEQSARYFASDSLGRPALDPTVFGYNYDMVSGASYDIDLRLPAGTRIRNLAVRGRPVAPGDTVTMAVNSYRQSGGGGFTMLRGAPVVYDRDENIRDLLIKEVQERRVVDPTDLDDTNWRIVPAEAAARVRELFGAAGTAAAPPRPAETILARLLVLGEFRGAVNPRAAALATALDRAERECGCDPVRVAPGGLLQGTLAADVGSGRPAVEVLNRLGLAASSVGPRDVAWSLDTLRQRVAQSRFAWLGANLVDSATGRRPDWVGGYRVVQTGSLRVGLVGYVSPGALGALRAAGAKGLRIEGGAAGLADALAAVKRERADLTVVLAHAPLACGAAGCSGEAMELAAALAGSGVDVVVAAGDSSGAARVGSIQVLSVRPGALELATLDLVRTPVAARELRVARAAIDPERIPPDTGVATLVERAAARADTVGGRIIARIKLPLRRGGRGSSPLGDLVADAQRNALRGDVALVSDATLSGDLPAGPASYASLLALHQASRPLVTVPVKGAALKQLLEAAIDDENPPVYLSGVTLRYDPRAPAGRRIRRVRFADGRTLNHNHIYTVVVAEPLVRQRRFAALAGADLTTTTMTDVEALALYLRRLPQPVAPPEPGRLESTR